MIYPIFLIFLSWLDKPEINTLVLILNGQILFLPNFFNDATDRLHLYYCSVKNKLYLSKILEFFSIPFIQRLNNVITSFQDLQPSYLQLTETEHQVFLLKELFFFIN